MAIHISFGFVFDPDEISHGREVTAYDAYYKAIKEFNLPASIPVVTEDGYEGMATQAMDFLENDRAFQMIFSEDRMERAKAAIYACQHTAKHVKAAFSDLITP